MGRVDEIPKKFIKIDFGVSELLFTSEYSNDALVCRIV